MVVVVLLIVAQAAQAAVALAQIIVCLELMEPLIQAVVVVEADTTLDMLETVHLVLSLFATLALKKALAAQSLHPADTQSTPLHLAEHTLHKMEKITLSAELVNAIIGYLGTRPYQEVFQLVDAMQKEAKEQNDRPN